MKKKYLIVTILFVVFSVGFVGWKILEFRVKTKVDKVLIEKELNEKISYSHLKINILKSGIVFKDFKVDNYGKIKDFSSEEFIVKIGANSARKWWRDKTRLPSELELLFSENKLQLNSGELLFIEEIAVDIMGGLSSEEFLLEDLDYEILTNKMRFEIPTLNGNSDVIKQFISLSNVSEAKFHHYKKGYKGQAAYGFEIFGDNFNAVCAFSDSNNNSLKNYSGKLQVNPFKMDIKDFGRFEFGGANVEFSGGDANQNGSFVKIAGNVFGVEGKVESKFYRSSIGTLFHFIEIENLDFDGEASNGKKQITFDMKTNLADFIGEVSFKNNSNIVNPFIYSLKMEINEPVDEIKSILFFLEHVKKTKKGYEIFIENTYFEDVF